MPGVEGISRILFTRSGGLIGRILRGIGGITLRVVPGLFGIALSTLEGWIARVHGVQVGLTSSGRAAIHKALLSSAQGNLLEVLVNMADFANFLGRIPQGFTIIDRLYPTSDGTAPFVQGFLGYLEGKTLEDSTRSAWGREDLPSSVAEANLRRYLSHHPNYVLNNLRIWTHLPQDFAIRKQRVFEALKGERGPLLDLGCSFNPWVEEYKTWEHFVGVDVSLMSLRVGVLIDPVNRGRLVNSDAQGLPFRDATFQAVISSEVLEHVPHPDQVIQEMRRVLRRNGLAVISVPMHVVDRLIPVEQGDPTHRGTFYTFDELCNVFRRYGFDIETVSSDPYYIFTLRKSAHPAPR